jgi:hypothetical protein
MKIAEILRQVADLLDQEHSPSQGADMSTNLTHQRMDAVALPEPADSNDATMVPPLQAKLEILKKSEGLPNVYDDNDNDDQLHSLRRHAGITVAQSLAADDEPLDM